MMRKFLLALALVLCAPLVANAATCYWVAGTSYNAATSWSSSSGGAGNTCAATGGIPKNASDVATLDALSPASTTLLVDVDIASMATIDMRNLSGSSGLDFTTHNVTLTTSFLGTGTGTRSLSLGSGTITLANGGLWNLLTTTGLTFSAGTATIAFNISSTAGTFFGGGKTYNTISVAGSSAAYMQFESGNNANVTMNNLTVAAGTQITMRANQTLTVNNGIAAVGTAANPVYIASDAASFSQITLAAGAASTCNWCIFRNVVGSTSAITATNSTNVGGQSTGTLSISNPGSGGGGAGYIIGGQ